SVFDYDGNVVLASGDVLTAKPALSALRDADGQAMNALLRGAIENPRGLLVRSRWPAAADKGSASYLQINFARAYPQWRWVVTTGCALRELDAMLDRQRAGLRARVQQRIAYVGLAVAALLLLATLFAQHLPNRTSR